MSGGTWEYRQYQLDEVIDDIQNIIEKNGLKKTERELDEKYPWRPKDWYEKYPEDAYHYKYPDAVIERLKEAVTHLLKARVYMHRVDWLLAGDDGDESFLSRLDEELKQIEE